MLGWTEGLDRRPKEAKAFYATIAVATLGGVALNFTSLDPVKALYWSAVVNGVLAAPLMAVMMVIAMNKRIMGRLTLPRPMLVVGWLATFRHGAGNSRVFLDLIHCMPFVHFLRLRRRKTDCDFCRERANGADGNSTRGIAMPRMSRRLAALAAVFSLAIAGCLAGFLAAPAQAQQKPVIKVSSLTLPVFNPLVWNVMKARGLDVKNGFELDIKAYPSISGFLRGIRHRRDRCADRRTDDPAEALSGGRARFASSEPASRCPTS